MKKLIAATVATSLMLGGCASTGINTTGINNAIANIDAYIAEAQQIAVNTCSFLPQVQSVATIITSLIGPAAAASDAVAAQAANDICKAIASSAPATTTTKSIALKNSYLQAAFLATGPVVADGVQINGWFVNKKSFKLHMK